MLLLAEQNLEDKIHPYSNLRNKYLCINPVIAIKNLQAGDVVFSNSGNVRLVIFNRKEYKNNILIFLSVLNGHKIKIEQTQCTKIDYKKLEIVIRRKDVLPLENFIEFGATLTEETSVLKNVGALIQLGEIGERLKLTLNKARAQHETVKLIFNCNKANALIESFGTQMPDKNLVKCIIEMSTRQNPYNEYIKKLKLYPGHSSRNKKELILATMYATCIQNAIRLYELTGGGKTKL